MGDPDDHSRRGDAHALLTGLLDLPACHVAGDDGDQGDGESADSREDVREERTDPGGEADDRQGVRFVGGDGRRVHRTAWTGWDCGARRHLLARDLSRAAGGRGRRRTGRGAHDKEFTEKLSASAWYLGGPL